jgi:FAD/FMN-containing dehydrogenase
MKISNWGNYPTVEARIKSFRGTADLKAVFAEFPDLISRGLGRSYGDASLAERVLNTLRSNRLLAFDQERGIIRCESGTSLSEILEVIVPTGWFLPVTPGTKYVTVGGAISADVHGKNHHREGTFTDHVVSMEVALTDGSVSACSPETNRDLFHAVCGGMGLAGIILDATFSLKRIETAYIRQETLKANNLDEVMDQFEEHKGYTYSVAWIDCLAAGGTSGRSILMLGEHARGEELGGRSASCPLRPEGKRKLNVPFMFPSFVINRLSAGAFNFLYYHKLPGLRRSELIDYDSFFYPLDAIHNWNRIYGSRGFMQYQCVFPRDMSRKALKILLEKIKRSGEAPFLAVLKLFGKRNSNVLSFPMEGYTLAVDFPITSPLFKFLEELDQVVLDHGGRLYLAKDARMTEGMFKKSYENAVKFREVKYRFDPANRLRSLQSGRLGI